MSEFNQLLSQILEELKCIRADLGKHQTGIALIEQTTEQHADKLKEHSTHIDDLRQTKWKLAGFIAAISGIASFLGSKLAALFSNGTPPTPGH